MRDTADLGADDPVDALRAQQIELIDMVAGCSAPQLLLPSRCENWCVADVLLHLAQSNEMAVSSLAGRLAEHIDSTAETTPGPLEIESWVDQMVGAERTTPEEARDRYLASATAQEVAFRQVDPTARVMWAAGEMAARTLATTRLTEAWIHSGDVAIGLGRPLRPTDRLWHTARLVWRTVPYALERDSERTDGHPRVVSTDEIAFDLIGTSGTPWVFGDPTAATIVVTGDAVELCEVAGQRRDVTDSSLRVSGAGGDLLLRRLRTFV